MATDELRLNNLGACHWLCPACGSDDWKSAKLVVLENTTNIDGGGRGNVRDPGMFSGSGREFFLSERWFSWDNPIDLRLELTATTKLVEEVKNFMLSYSDRLGTTPKYPGTTPKRHVVPDKRKFFRGYERPPQIWVPGPPKIPERPVKPDPPKRRTFRQHVSELITMTMSVTIVALLLIGISAIFLDVTIKGALITIGVFLVLGVFAYKDGPKDVYKRDLRKYEKLQRKYVEAEQAAQDHPQQIARAREEYEKAQARYVRRLAEYDAAVHRSHCEEAGYLTRVANIESLRELLWNSARVCMRCGKCYLGERID